LKETLMSSTHPTFWSRRIVALSLGAALLVGAAPREAWTQPRRPVPVAAKKPAPATQADIDRLEKKIAEQQRLIERLVRLQQQYLASLVALMPDAGGGGPPPPLVAAAEPKVDPKAAKSDAAIETGTGTGTPAKPDPKADPKPGAKPGAKPDPKAVAVKKPGAGKTGTVVGKVKGGGGDTYVYISDIVSNATGSATMKQEGKQFVPRVMAVQKGMRVEFPNLDAVFHNVFSVTPDNSFDLGSYRQGESKSVTMSKPGVISVYCNMHPQMVGHILVVPSSLYARAGADGFYRLTNIPAGKHKLVAWAPNSKPVSMDVDIVEDEVTTIELEVKRGRSGPHMNKDGLPYGSYKD
jgi:plastocyanin